MGRDRKPTKCPKCDSLNCELSLDWNIGGPTKVLQKGHCYHCGHKWTVGPDAP